MYSLREAAEAPLGELINMTGLLVCKEEQEEEAKVKLVLDEEGEEIALYLPSSSLPPATLPGMRFEATSVKRASSNIQERPQLPPQHPAHQIRACSLNLQQLDLLAKNADLA